MFERVDGTLANSSVIHLGYWSSVSAILSSLIVISLQFEFLRYKTILQLPSLGAHVSSSRNTAPQKIGIE